MPKSPEALRIFFSSQAPLRALSQGEFSQKEKKLIQAAILSAKTPNPDIELLRQADALLRLYSKRSNSASKKRPSPAFSKHIRYGEGELAQLSKEMERAEDIVSDRRTLWGWLYWRWKWKHIYAPIITLLLILTLSMIVTKCSFIKDRIKASPKFGILNFTRFDDAKRRCEKIGQSLASTPKQILERIDSLDKTKAQWGYWLRDGRVFIPDTYKIIPADKRMHGFVCVPK